MGIAFIGVGRLLVSLHFKGTVEDMGCDIGLVVVYFNIGGWACFVCVGGGGYINNTCVV